MAKIKLLSAEEIADGLLTHIASLQGNKGMRGQAIKRNGQYYVFDGGNLKATFAQLKTVKLKGQKGKAPLFDSKNLDVSGLIRKIDKIWETEQTRYKSGNTERYNLLNKQKKQVATKAGVATTGAKVYIVLNYAGIQRVNIKKVNPLIIKMMEESLKGDTAGLKRLKASPMKSILSGDQKGQKGFLTNLDGTQEVGNLGTQLGHGEFGKPIAALQAEAIGAWAKKNRNNMSAEQYQQIQDALITIESILDCSLSYESVKDGELQLDAQLIVSNQLTIENKSDAAALEQPIAAWLMTYLTQQVVKGQGFGHWATAVTERKVLTQLFKGWRIPGVTFDKTLPELHKLDTSAERTSKKKKVRQAITMMTGWGGTGLLGKILSNVKKEQYSKLGVKTGEKGVPGKEDRRKVVQIIRKAQKALHKEVQQRMNYPALQYQSGRFAESVQLMNLTQTARGLKAQYEYDMEHYGTFEPGNKQGSRARDPNRLIEEALTRATHSTSGVIPTLFQRIG